MSTLVLFDTTTPCEVTPVSAYLLAQLGHVPERTLPRFAVGALESEATSQGAKLINEVAA